MSAGDTPWRETTLGELLSIKHGFAFLGEYFGDSGSHVVLTPGNFNEEGGFVDRREKSKWYRGPIPAEYVLDADSLLVAMTEQAEGLLGSSALVPRSSLYLHNQRLGLVQVRDPCRADTRFLYYLFNHRPVRQQIRASASGTKIRHTSPTRIEAVVVPVPGVEQQRRIASTLTAYDDLIENCQRRIRILEDMARGLYREWFVHFRFPGADSLPQIESPLGRIPQGWKALSCSGVASYFNGYAFKPAQLGVEGLPVIKIKELKAGVVVDTPRNDGGEVPEKYHVLDGDLLFSWSADLDVYLWRHGEGLLNQHLFNVLPNEGFTTVFLYHCLKEAMPRFRAISLGATMHHIKRSALDQVVVAVPPAVHRERFVALAGPMHAGVRRLTKKIELLRRTRDLLLPRLMSGQLDLRSAEGTLPA